MRDAGVDIEAHSETHQDLRKPYDKVAKKRLNPQEYQQWLQDEIARLQADSRAETWDQGQLLRTSRTDFYNDHVKEIAKNAGYEAIFTVYGQPITYTLTTRFARPLLDLRRTNPKCLQMRSRLSGIQRRARCASGCRSGRGQFVRLNPPTAKRFGLRCRLFKANLSSIRPDRSGQCADAGKWPRACPGELRSENRHCFLSSYAKTAG